jgi:hypothetical protein
MSNHTWLSFAAPSIDDSKECAGFPYIHLGF